jgi:pimeloyl-ACP methyl ester carboxylesterase
MTFCRVLRYLRPHYHVHALDTFGVGHSSQGSFTHQLSHQQVVDYYIDAVEQWRVQRGIKNFTLVGHSFGGYLAALYCEKYGERVNRLVLLSPAGIIRKSDEEIRRELDEWRGTGCGTRLLVFFMERVYKWNVRPSKAMNSYLVGSRLIDRIVDGHFDLKEEESAAWKKYFRHLAGRDNMGEFGFYHLF